MERANKYLHEVYIPNHNEKFTVEPRNNADLHRSIDGYNINTIFSIKQSRTLREDNTIVYKNRWFQIEQKQLVKLKKYEKITLIIDFDHTIKLMTRGHFLKFKEIPKESPREKKKKEEKVVNRKSYRPSPNHPWNTWQRNPERDISTLHKR